MSLNNIYGDGINNGDGFYDKKGRIENLDAACYIASLENEGHNSLPKSYIERIINIINKILTPENLKLKEAKKLADEYEKIRLKQYQIGEVMFNKFKESADNNENYNILNKNSNSNYGPISIEKNRGNNYSIFIGIINNDTKENHKLYTIKISLAIKEIHVLNEIYDKGCYYPIDSLVSLTDEISNEILEFDISSIKRKFFS